MARATPQNLIALNSDTGAVGSYLVPDAALVVVTGLLGYVLAFGLDNVTLTANGCGAFGQYYEGQSGPVPVGCPPLFIVCVPGSLITLEYDVSGPGDSCALTVTGLLLDPSDWTVEFEQVAPGTGLPFSVP